MSEKEQKWKHMSYYDRETIEDGLTQGLSFREISEIINKDASTVSKEVRKHRTFKFTNRFGAGTNCAKVSSCTKRHLCPGRNCDIYCSCCTRIRCDRRCADYEATGCMKLKKPPYVCNGCERKQFCREDKYYYRAKIADDSYCSVLRDSRNGIDITPEDLNSICTLVTPLIKNGQPIAHIFANHSDEIPCSRRTLYSYIDRGLLGAKNIDLPRKVRYKPRKARNPVQRAEPDYARKRTYTDFKKHLDEHPGTNVIEMDTVEGIKGGKVLLTMLFRNSSLMVIFLLNSKSQEEVLRVFDWLYSELGSDVFEKTFPVILPDRGTEFQCPTLLEYSSDGKRRTRIFYCDPQCSWQKGSLEKNHEFIRYVIPKGNSFDFFTQNDMTLLANHINSLSRDGLNGQSPFDIAQLLQNSRLLRKCGLKKIPPDSVCLRKKLLSGESADSVC